MLAREELAERGGPESCCAPAEESLSLVGRSSVDLRFMLEGNGTRRGGEDAEIGRSGRERRQM